MRIPHHVLHKYRVVSDNILRRLENKLLLSASLQHPPVTSALFYKISSKTDENISRKFFNRANAKLL